MSRGDQALARGDIPEALAEYRLALRQGERTAPVLVRTAYAYGASRRVSEAVAHYKEAVAVDASYADQAAADLLALARRSVQANDGVAAAEAVAGAMAIQPGVNSDGLALPIATHFANSQQYTPALPYYERAVRETNRRPQVVFALAVAYDEVEDCATAIDLFQEVWSRLNVASRQEADWRTGTCSMELAAEAREDGDPNEALRHYETTITLQQPRGVVPEAWFGMGEVLAQMGRCEEAREAFTQVERNDPSAALREQARNRADAIRFRSGSSGSC